MASARRRTVGMGVGLVGFVALALGFGGAGHAEAQGWSVPRTLGESVNSPFDENLPHIARSGLSLYFISNRPGFGSFDIWVSQREAPGDKWGPPMNLGPIINTSSNERGPCLSADGQYLFFSSDRPGGFGSQDLWRSFRADPSDDFGWQAPENLGGNVNTAAPDFGAGLLELSSHQAFFTALFFGRRGKFGDADIYMSTVGSGGFLKGVRVAELSTPDDDLRPTIRPDGLELFFNSDRPGPNPSGYDLWVSTRNSPHSPWSPPVNAGPVLNTEFDEEFPALSGDGTELVFSSNRPGSINASDDLYVSRRWH